jgi:hypothetical protein
MYAIQFISIGTALYELGVWSMEIRQLCMYANARPSPFLVVKTELRPILCYSKPS